MGIYYGLPFSDYNGIVHSEILNLGHVTYLLQWTVGVSNILYMNLVYIIHGLICDFVHFSCYDTLSLFYHYISNQ